MAYPKFKFDIGVSIDKNKQDGDLVYEYQPFRNLQQTDGKLGDLETEQLNFKLTNPVNIEVQPSYDGSTNLILNDDLNPPRLINSRFTVKEDKQFSIVDRKGDDDTNIYRDKDFDIQTRLFKTSKTIPFIDFLGIEEGGNLKAGNYTFYFKYIDSDLNESDIFAESGIIPVHEGNVNIPSSITGGVLNTNCNKIIKLKLSNVDTSYDYISIYYLRQTGENSFSRIDEYVKISDNKIIDSSTVEITITGFENTKIVNDDSINSDFNIVTRVKTQTQVQNMLFFGNVDKASIPYTELTDLSLRILPEVTNDKGIGFLTKDYVPESGDYSKVEYYNMKNVYYHTGYWDNEIYRLGVVYIMKDDSISPVFNIRGCDNLRKDMQLANIPIYEGSGDSRKRKYIATDNDNLLKDRVTFLENSKGVIRIRTNGSNNLISETNNIRDIKPLGLTFNLTDELLTEIKKYAKGLCFVRQKRIPTIIGQGLTIGVDNESSLPCIKDSKNFIFESFVDNNKVVTSNFNQHRITNSTYLDKVNFKGILAPEIDNNQLLSNGLFNNSDLIITNAFIDNNKSYLEGTDRHYYINDYVNKTPLSNIYEENKLVHVKDGSPLAGVKTTYFSALAGTPEDVTSLKYIGMKNKSRSASNIVRGKFTSYLGCLNELPEHKLVNIHIPGYSLNLIEEYFGIRYNSLSAYYPIGNRYDLDLLTNSPTTYSNVAHPVSTLYKITEYRGDCYINTVTVRMNRNFQDPETPLNNDILDVYTWKNNYVAPGEDKGDRGNDKINRNDINAVNLGHWVTFKICSTFNLALRSFDSSNTSEMAIVGKPRTFYPANTQSPSAENKIEESKLFNIGYSTTTGSKQYQVVPDVPYLKNTFDNRIMFSQKHVNDAFMNGYRIFQGLQYQDITRQYGGIVKINDWNNNLLVVFENGICALPINEKAMVSSELGDSIALYGAGVLPEKETTISIDYGSRWQDSIIRTPRGLYGVDSEAKKIWRFKYDGTGFEIISDFKIGQYLNKHLNLENKDHSPIIGLRNIKTHYDEFKGDVIFSFYNHYGLDTRKHMDFNFVYNERVDKWITRSDWTPLTSANINNIFITFDKQKAYNIALNAYSLADSEYSNGIVISDNIHSVYDLETPENIFSEILSLKGYDSYVDYSKTYELVSFNGFNNDETATELSRFSINGNKLNITGKETITGVLTLKVTLTKVIGGITSSVTFNDYLFIDTNDVNYIKASSSLYKHGFATLFKITDNPVPLKWYDLNHDFEFEVVVNDKYFVQKILDNVNIISNKTQPQEIEVWVTGDSYDFTNEELTTIFPHTQEIKSVSTYGRVRGNAHYKENVWNVEVKPAHITKNNTIKEFKIRDKYFKIRVKYTGNDPVIITSLQTLYTLSYA